MNKDVVESLRGLQMAVNHAQDTSADTATMNAYGKLWISVVNAAARCASDLEHKKVAPSAANTESEKQKSSKSSVVEKPADVKCDRTSFIFTRHIQGGSGVFQAVGDPFELALDCAKVIEGLAEKLSKDLMIASVLAGCGEAGITIDEMVAAQEGANGHA